MPAILRVAAACVRAWTRAYTCHLPTGVRDTRRAEIDSDLWEFQHDPRNADEARGALHLLVRLAGGMGDDICWRLEQAAVLGRTSRRLVAITALALVVSAGWLLYQLRGAVLPRPPASPMAWGHRPPPDPPPPPPPPCEPPGFTAGCTP